MTSYLVEFISGAHSGATRAVETVTHESAALAAVERQESCAVERRIAAGDVARIRVTSLNGWAAGKPGVEFDISGEVIAQYEVVPVRAACAKCHGKRWRMNPHDNRPYACTCIAEARHG